MNMLKFIKILCVTILLMGLLPETSMAQASACDTCTAVWGPVQRKVYTSQTINGLMPYCLYNVYLDIQTRVCNGKVQVKLLSQYIQSSSTDPACKLACIHVGSLMQKISKLLLVDLGGNIVLNKPAACYYLLEFQLTPDMEACLGSEASLYDHWYAPLPCDDNGCCVTEYILQPDGSVRTVTSVSTPCTGTPPSPVPSSITVYCWSGGVMNAYIVPVVPPTDPLTCEVACTTTGYIFTARMVQESAIESADVQEVFPNPTDGLVYFEHADRVKHISVFDVYGKKVADYEGQSKSVNLNSFVAGTYWLVVDQIDGEQLKYTLIKR